MLWRPVGFGRERHAHRSVSEVVPMFAVQGAIHVSPERTRAYGRQGRIQRVYVGRPTPYFLSSSGVISFAGTRR